MSKAPSLLEQLSQIRREEELEEKAFLDERWDRLAAGTLTEAENDELLGLADVSGEDHVKYQAFKSLGPAFEKNLVAMILARQAVEREKRAADLPAATAEPDAERHPPKKYGAWTWALGGLAPLAATVLAAVFWLPAPMPPYTLHAGSGEQSDMRTDTEAPGGAAFSGHLGPLKVLDGSRLQLAYRPASPWNFTPEAKLYLESQDGSLQPAGVEPLAAAAKSAETADLIIFEPLVGHDLVLPEGRSRLVVVIGQKDHLPNMEEIRAAIADGGTEPSFWKNWQVLLQPVFKVAP